MVLTGLDETDIVRPGFSATTRSGLRQWLGPASKKPFNASRFHFISVVLDYAGGFDD